MVQRCYLPRSRRRRILLGHRLFLVRSRRGMTLREVEERSRQIARRRGDASYILAKGRLSQIENSNTLPRIHKLVSLSEIYAVPLLELLALYGIEPPELPSQKTAPSQAEAELERDLKFTQATD